jgi:hypothetical protein
MRRVIDIEWKGRIYEGPALGFGRTVRRDLMGDTGEKNDNRKGREQGIVAGSLAGHRVLAARYTEDISLCKLRMRH